MAGTSKEKKKKIFKLFSQNLEWVKEHPQISFNPDFSNGYICPLCLGVFFEKDLDTAGNNYLTIEDIPPKSLGGKPLALTCKKCNSIGGHELDAHLLNRLLELDSSMFLPNSKSQSTLELNGNTINGTVEVNQTGTLKLDLHRHRSNPQMSDIFMKDFLPNTNYFTPFIHPNGKLWLGIKSPTITMNLKKMSQERRAEIALLRTAYLLAYATFGNGFLFNGGLHQVREQISNPDKEILPPAFWINYDFPAKMEGMNIISLPKDLRCFLVIFNLETKSKKRQYAVALPGPSEPEIKVYNYIENEICVGDGTKFTRATVEHIGKRDFLRKKETSFESYRYWRDYTKLDYVPASQKNK